VSKSTTLSINSRIFKHKLLKYGPELLSNLITVITELCFSFRAFSLLVLNQTVSSGSFRQHPKCLSFHKVVRMIQQLSSSSEICWSTHPPCNRFEYCISRRSELFYSIRRKIFFFMFSIHSKHDNFLHKCSKRTLYSEMNTTINIYKLSS